MSVIADKSWYKSKTIWTAVVVCAASIAGEFGIEIPESVFGVLVHGFVNTFLLMGIGILCTILYSNYSCIQRHTFILYVHYPSTDYASDLVYSV